MDDETSRERCPDAQSLRRLRILGQGSELLPVMAVIVWVPRRAALPMVSRALPALFSSWVKRT
jgi:hypothetical protein